MVIYFLVFVIVVFFCILLLKIVVFVFLFTCQDGFVAIANKLERLLNLRILTEGTEAYTVVEKCMGLARSYIGQPTIGHRSRRRRRTNNH